MKFVGIREFEARLSEYLREVQTGETILVTDRGRVVAEVRSPGATDAGGDTVEQRLQRAVDAGLVRRATVPPEEREKFIRQLVKRAPRLDRKELEAERLLDELRGDKDR
jgi:antitoxin (DNA-binding transcriptional repressor) of toxin-antitoxin stability system